MRKPSESTISPSPSDPACRSVLLRLPRHQLLQLAIVQTFLRELRGAVLFQFARGAPRHSEGRAREVPTEADARHTELGHIGNGDRRLEDDVERPVDGL